MQPLQVHGFEYDQSGSALALETVVRSANPVQVHTYI